MSKSDFKIEDLSTWRHKDAAFVVMLGYACGWSIQPNTSGAVRMYSQDGTQVTVPDNQSLNINVFRSWLSKVWRHRRTSVSPAAFEAMVGPAKLDRPHVKIAWGATGMEPPTPLPADDPRHDERVEVDETDWSTVDLRDDAAHREAAETVAALIDSAMHPEAPVIEYEKPRLDKPAADFKDHGVTLRVEPNTYKKNKQSQLVVVAEHVLRRTWSDGYIDFACADCGHVSASPSGIGGHRVIHGPHATARGRKGAEARAAMKAEAEAERDERRREKDRIRKRKARGMPLPDDADGNASVSPMPPPPPAWSDTAKLQQIADLVFPSMLMRIEAITEERDAAIARAEKAEGDLDALRDLLGARK